MRKSSRIEQQRARLARDLKVRDEVQKECLAILDRLEPKVIKLASDRKALLAACNLVLSRVEHTNIHTPIGDMLDTWEVLRKVLFDVEGGAGSEGVGYCTVHTTCRRHTRHDRARELRRKLINGPGFSDLALSKFTPEEATRQFKLWSSTWIIDELTDLIPELKKEPKGTPASYKVGE